MKELILFFLITFASLSSASDIHWSYEGNEGPEHWGELDPSFEACGHGKAQSPIDLTKAEAKDLTNIKLNYRASPIRILNNGHTVQINFQSGNSIEFGEQKYELVQFHFHTPSEHTLNGKFYPAELHLVHKNIRGDLAVVGVLLEKGNKNTAFEPVFLHLPAKETPEKAIAIKINPADLFPQDQRSYRYEGSLTAPPCSEGVSWLVLATPVNISDGQINSLHQILHNNNRPLQQLHGRPLVMDSTQ